MAPTLSPKTIFVVVSILYLSNAPYAYPGTLVLPELDPGIFPVKQVTNFNFHKSHERLPWDHVTYRFSTIPLPLATGPAALDLKTKRGETTYPRTSKAAVLGD